MTQSKSGLFSYLVILTGFFLLLEFSFFLQCSGFYLGDLFLVAKHIQLPLKIIPGILFFISAQLFLHLAYLSVVWLIARLIGQGLQFTWDSTQKLGFTLWGMGIITVLLANQHYVINSRFSELSSILFPPIIANILFYVLASVISLVLITASICLLIILFKNKILLPSLFVLVSLIFCSQLLSINHTVLIADASTKAKPNIILIGVDGLRPDFLGYFNGNNKTVYLDDFLNHSVVFAESLTPIARTFPSWTGVLLGQYPKHSGMRYDLADQSLANYSQSLPNILKQQGYQTIYATDDTRFSNIGENFGFDKIITPPTGLNDFILGAFNDFPMSNLMLNTRLGKFLFPHSFGNRAAEVTYDPDSFLSMLKPTIEHSRDKPLFLAIHFCLSHYSYIWKDYTLNNQLDVLSRYRSAYQASTERVDQQVNDLLSMLQASGALKSSIVILLSDHGEALEFAGDRVTENDLYLAKNNATKAPRFYPPSLDSEKINQSTGHGTDILGMTQNHSVLAFRFYGEHVDPKIVVGIVSLIDIKPTLLDLLKIKAKKSDGISLAQVLKNGQHRIASRGDFFMESDFSPAAVRTVHPETRKLLFEGIDIYSVNPDTTRLTVKESMGKMILNSKQYADLYGKWVLAYYPQANGKSIPILVNLESGNWTDDLDTDFAKQSPAKHMIAALDSFFGNDLNLKNTPVLD